MANLHNLITALHFFVIVYQEVVSTFTQFCTLPLHSSGLRVIDQVSSQWQLINVTWERIAINFTPPIGTWTQFQVTPSLSTLYTNQGRDTWHPELIQYFTLLNNYKLVQWPTTDPIDLHVAVMKSNHDHPLLSDPQTGIALRHASLHTFPFCTTTPVKPQEEASQDRSSVCLSTIGYLLIKFTAMTFEQ